MSVNLPLSAQLEKLELLPRAEINKILKTNGYRWEKVTQDDLDDNDDFERQPGWYLYSPDGREVTVQDAIDEIVLGVRLASRIRGLESYRDAEAARIAKLFKSWYRAVVVYVKEYGENIGEASFDANEKLYDSRNYGIGHTIRTDGQTIFVTDYHGSDMMGPISYKMSVTEDEDEMAEYGNSNAQIVAALRGMAANVAMPILTQKGLGIKAPVDLAPIADLPALPADTPEFISVFFRDQVNALPFTIVEPEACKTPRCACWLSVDKYKFAFDHQYIYLRAGAPTSDDQKTSLAERYWGEAVWPYIHIRAKLTPVIDEWIKAHSPEWYDAEIHRQLCGYSGCYVESTRSAWPAEGTHGRFKTSALGYRLAHCVRDALRISSLDSIPLDMFEFIPGVELLYTNGQSGLTGTPFSIWSDGPQSIETFAHKMGEPLSKDATFLISIAGRMKLWRPNDAWRQFMDVGIVEKKSLKKDEKGGRSSGSFKSLESLHLSNATTVWLVNTGWWAMGEDGDADEDNYLFPTLAEAQKAYAKIELH